MLQTVQEDCAPWVGAKLFGEKLTYKDKLAYTIVSKAEKIEKKHGRKVLKEEMAYITDEGAKHLFDKKHLVEKYKPIFLEVLLKQLNYIDGIKNIKNNATLYMRMNFVLERLFYKNHSGNRRAATDEFYKHFIADEKELAKNKRMKKLAEEMPQRLSEWNDELCLYEEDGEWYVDNVSNRAETNDDIMEKAFKEKIEMLESKKKEIEEEIAEVKKDRLEHRRRKAKYL